MLSVQKMDYCVFFLLYSFFISGVFQENGQRRYGGPPPSWDGPPPERGSEIFVGKLPRDLFEDELVPLCEKVRVYYWILSEPTIFVMTV